MNQKELEEKCKQQEEEIADIYNQYEVDKNSVFL